MTWIQLDQDWGLPAVNICISRQYLKDSGALSALADFEDHEASRQRLQTYVERLLDVHYPGLQVVALHYDYVMDAILIMILHPSFLRTRAYEHLPCWRLRGTTTAQGTFDISIDTGGSILWPEPGPESGPGTGESA